MQDCRQHSRWSQAQYLAQGRKTREDDAQSGGGVGPITRDMLSIVPVTDILGRLALVPSGEHGTIPMPGMLLRDSMNFYPRGGGVSSNTSIPGP